MKKFKICWGYNKSSDAIGAYIVEAKNEKDARKQFNIYKTSILTGINMKIKYVLETE